MKKNSYSRKATFGMGFVLLMVSAVMLQITGTVGAQEKGKIGNNWKLPHLGRANITIVVRDADKAAEYYESFGMGSFGPKSRRDVSAYPEYRLYGKTPAVRGKGVTRQIQAGPTGLELLQSLEGVGLHTEFLERHGEGVDHFTLRVDDIDKVTAELVAKGFPVVVSATVPSGTRYRYFDTRKFGNLCLELVQVAEEHRLLDWEAQMNRRKKAKWDLHHLPIVVRDLDKAVEYYESCGLGPFEPEFTIDASAYPEYRVYGKTPASPYKAKARRSKHLPIVLELFEPLEGGHIHEEFLERHGEGVDHIAFVVDDIEKVTAKLVAKGFPVVVSATTDTGTRYRYFDTRKFGNLYLQLIQRP